MDQLCPVARMSASAHPRPSRSSTHRARITPSSWRDPLLPRPKSPARSPGTPFLAHTPRSPPCLPLNLSLRPLCPEPRHAAAPAPPAPPPLRSPAVPWSCATADMMPCYACTLADPALALLRLQESSRARCPDSQPLRLPELLRTTTGLQRVDPWSPAARGASAATSLVVAIPGSSQFELYTSRNQPAPSQLSPVP